MNRRTNSLLRLLAAATPVAVSTALGALMGRVHARSVTDSARATKGFMLEYRVVVFGTVLAVAWSHFAPPVAGLTPTARAIHGDLFLLGLLWVGIGFLLRSLKTLRDGGDTVVTELREKPLNSFMGRKSATF